MKPQILKQMATYEKFKKHENMLLPSNISTCLRINKRNILIINHLNIFNEKTIDLYWTNEYILWDFQYF